MELKDSKLFNELEKRKSKFIPNIESVFTYAKDTLPLIVKVFSNYTQHDVGHSIRVGNYMYDLVEDISEMNELEITIMLYSCLFHDIGMVVTDEEIEKIKEDSFEDIESKYSVVFAALKDEKMALQECIRPIHAFRSAQHLKNMGNEYKTWFIIPQSTNKSFLQDIQKICQSHNESIEWIKTELDTEGCKIDYNYNLQYISLLLRIADLLDFDEQRTPYYLYKLINPKGFSDNEWKQHFIIDNAQKIYINDKNRQKVIRLFGESSEAWIHRKFLKYVDYINRELVEAVNISESFQDVKYVLNIKTNIENKVKTNGFTFSDFKLDLDYNAVTKLLMGERIYGDKQYGLRELIQNSIDACMLMREISKSHEDFMYESYNPFINIVLDEDKNEAIIVDNGIGMSLDILKKYFLNVGVSYYSSNEYKYKGYDYKPIGNYGIGFLACFMLSNNVKVYSKRYDDSKLNVIELESNSEYICLTQSLQNRKPGTDIILDLQEFKYVFENIDKVKGFIEKNFINCGIPIKIVKRIDGVTTEIGCNLIEIKNNSNSVARLDMYLKDIEGYIDLSSMSIETIKSLDEVEGNETYIYQMEGNKLISSSKSITNINDFIVDGKMNYLRVPIITDGISDDFNKYLDVLEDFDEVLNKLDNVDFINIFSIEEPLSIYVGKCDSYNDKIIGEFTFDDLCNEFGHCADSPTYVKEEEIYIISNNSEIILSYEKKKGFGSYSWTRTDKMFIKNVLVSDFAISLPYLIEGINVKSALFNIKNKSVIPNVARNNVSRADSDKISYAIGKALHLWVLDNVELSSNERDLIKIFIDNYYSEWNEFIYN